MSFNPSQMLNLPSITALRTFANPLIYLNQTVYVQGYYAPGDEGGGFFTITGTNPGTDDGGVFIHLNTSGYYAVRQIFDYVSVRFYGAKGDSTTDDTTAIQNAVFYCFGTAAAPHANNTPYLNTPLYFTDGRYKITTQISFPKITGAKIVGGGRISTTITNTTVNGSVFVTNGFQYSSMSGMQLLSNGTGISLDLDYDGDTTFSGAHQGSSFYDMLFGLGAVGCRIGFSGFQGSENSFYDCHAQGCSVAGYHTANFNALANKLFGGNVQSCTLGLWIERGTLSADTTGFQQSTTWDILMIGSANDATTFTNIRSESVNFISTGNESLVSLVCISHLGSAPGTFLLEHGTTTVTGCDSLQGIIIVNFAKTIVQNSWFGVVNWLSIPNGLNRIGGICAINVFYGQTPNGSPVAGSGQIEFQTWNLAGPFDYNRSQTIIIPSGNLSATLTIEAGCRVISVMKAVDILGTGNITVGDSGNSTRYFLAGNLATGNELSTTIGHPYTVADTITVQSSSVVGVTGKVIIQMIQET